MSWKPSRRGFLKCTLAGSALCAGCSGSAGRVASAPDQAASGVAGFISPGCRGTRVRVGKIYTGLPKAHWPTPSLDLNAEMQRYEAKLAQMPELADVDFVGNTLVSTVDEARQAREKMADVDGILVIHLSMGTTPLLTEILAAGKPTIIFAAPYSGHEWTSFGPMQQKNPLLDCLLTSDTGQLAAAIRPFRAIHHLREARILNITARELPTEWVESMKTKFGTEVIVIGKQRVLDAYDAIPETDARAEAARWIRHADALVEPGKEEVVRSCRLALAFEKLMDEERATVITTDCYGSMYHQLPAFPCVGNVRMNDMGLGGICESDLRSAMTHIALQALTGKPGFISDPTMDLSTGSIILAHCLGSRKMDGPAGPSAPYKLRTIMERQEGCVPQVKMRLNQPVTQAILVDAGQIRYFTGTIIDVPESQRGCRTKITVKVDGNPDNLWRNWSNGLHRVTFYGHVTDDLRRLCRFKDIKMIDEAV